MKKVFRSSSVRSYGTLAKVIRAGQLQFHVDVLTNMWLFHI
jgi:hypothetical protein